MGAAQSLEEEQTKVCPHIRVQYLVAHRINDPEDVAEMLEDGANGIEIDLRSNGTTWFVNHDRCSGYTIQAYMAKLTSPYPLLMFLDIKTPRARNLEELGGLIAAYPTIKFVFCTAKHSDELLRLPQAAVLAIDLAMNDNVERVVKVMDAAQRTYWLGDGNMPLLPKPSMRYSYRQFQATRAVGTYAWTYSSLNALKADMVQHKMDMTTVTPALVKSAAQLLRRCRPEVTD